MRKEPAEFIVYWTSKFNGEKHGSYTEKYKANMKAFATLESAKKCHDKLVELQKVGGIFGTRVVHHVGDFSQ